MNNMSEEEKKVTIKEARILEALKHPNIVKFYGVVSEQHSFKILLELVAGGSIAKMIETYKPFPENVLKKYTYQILKGLEYLHIHNVIHRDIKGGNILVDRNGICKLSDFGGSKVITDEIEYHQKNSLKGTPHWMAPEIIKSMEYTRFSDIWALGCTMIEMLTGNPPFSQFNVFEGKIRPWTSSELKPAPNSTWLHINKCSAKSDPDFLNSTTSLKGGVYCVTTHKAPTCSTLLACFR